MIQNEIFKLLYILYIQSLYGNTVSHDTYFFTAEWEYTVLFRYFSHFQEVNSAYSLCGCEMIVRGLNIARNILWFITVEKDVTKYCLPAKRGHALYTAVNS